MDKALLDTDIFSEILKNKNEPVARKATAYLQQFGRFTLSVLTVSEIVKGFHKRGREDRIQTLFAGLASEEIIPFELNASVIAGRIFADLEKTGQPIGRADPIIAAIAIERSFVLVTGNIGHFQRIERLGYPLRLENWKNSA